MGIKNILVVDDEKNIRLTLAQALESPEIAVRTAGSGEEALQMLTGSAFDLVLLDLRLPGLDGLEVLRRLRSFRPQMPVIMITAHGNVETAVAAMKLGALDFLRKPFGVEEVRGLVQRVLARQIPAGESPVDYQTLIEKAGKGIREGAFEASGETARRAIALDPGRPEAYNLLGALLEIRHDRLAAQKFYRAALEIDPTYHPAQANLERVTLRRRLEPVDLGSTA